MYDVYHQSVNIMSKHLTVRQKVHYALQSADAATNILSEKKGSRFYITFNRPKRYNAFSSDMYDSFTNLIEYANQDPEVKFIILSGSGGNFSSGNDLANFTNPKLHEVANTQELAVMSATGLEKFTATIINSRKPIFALVEGKVIGFAFTQLALYDRVFAVDNAQFNAPLVQLAQGPEMCASYTFPRIFGKHLGEDLIIKGTKVNAKFLEKYQFLQSYSSRAAAEQALSKHIGELEQLEWESYLTARKLFRDTQREALLTVNKNECKNLVERWCHPNLPAHLAQYMMNVKNKSKL